MQSTIDPTIAAFGLAAQGVPPWLHALQGGQFGLPQQGGGGYGIPWANGLGRVTPIEAVLAAQYAAPQAWQAQQPMQSWFQPQVPYGHPFSQIGQQLGTPYGTPYGIPNIFGAIPFQQRVPPWTVDPVTARYYTAQLLSQGPVPSPAQWLAPQLAFQQFPQSYQPLTAPFSQLGQQGSPYQPYSPGALRFPYQFSPLGF